MRRLRTFSLLAGFVVLVLAGALAACTNPAGGPDSTQGMIGGKGPDYSKD